MSHALLFTRGLCIDLTGTLAFEYLLPLVRSSHDVVVMVASTPRGTGAYSLI